MNIEITQVLLIDDDEDDFVNIRAILNEIHDSQYNLVWKNSYQSGLQALKECHYDVCLLDFRLGQLSGLDLLREAARTGIQTPIIFLTGFGDFEVDKKAMQTGAADYLVKDQLSSLVLERAIRYSVKNALDLSELTEQKENFKILFNSTFEGIVVHEHGIIVDANAAMGQILGIDPAAIVGTNVMDRVRSDFRPGLEGRFGLAAELQQEVVGLKEGGAEVHLGLSTKTIVLRGRPIGLLAVRDLTQQKLMEAQILQQDRLASLGLLASSLAHEIGTPLGVIRGRAELVAKSEDQKLKTTMELIISQIDRITKLVNSLLHLARGKTSEHSTDVDLGDVVSDVLNLMSHELNRKSIELTTAIADGLYVRAEQGPLGQVFLNLLVNSVHAIEELRQTEPQKNYSVEIVAEKIQDKVEVRVTDNGCGIAEANLNNIFKPFFTTKDVGLGSGLGLATSYKLVQSWGGSMSLSSKRGEGVTFTITLLAGRLTAD